MNEDFSERLRSARMRAGLKAKELAVKCRISASYLSELESGKRKNPANLLLEKFASECGVTVDWLLGRDTTAPGTAGVPPAPLQVYPPVRSAPAAVREDPCHYPGTLPAEVAAIRERLASMEADMHTISAQMQTITGLLSGALRTGIEKRKAG